MRFMALAGVSLALLAAAPVWAAAQPAAADTEASSRLGAQFTVPAGWALAQTPDMARMTAPEGNLAVAVIDVPAAADAAAAVAAAFKVHDPAAPRTVQLSAAMPADRGWEEMVGFVMAPRAGETGRLVQVIAHRKGRDWTVALAEGAMSTFEKRAAATMLALQGVRAPGFVKEDVSAVPAKPLDAAMIAGMSGFVESAMAALDIPGAAIALVDRGGVRFAKGFGVADLAGQTPVTADTLFMIASNTKGMATLMLGALVDEGRLGWEQRVVDVYPGFRLGDPALTERVKIGNLVCACTGVPRKDLPVFFSSTPNTPSARVFEFLADTRPTSAFGEAFQYNNLMASAAGFIGGQVAYPGMELGAGFDKAMETRVFGPLGMRSTTFDPAKAMAGRYARPHAVNLAGATVEADQAVNLVGFSFRPSGGAWSSATDMARYVLNEVNPGAPDGKRLMSAANVLVRRVPSVPLGEGGSYGMGLINSRVAGVPVVRHGGDVVGYKSDIYVLPEAGIGAVLLTNSDSGGALLSPFARRLVELAHGAAPRAEAEVKATAARVRTMAQGVAKTLQFPASPDVANGLAARYLSPDLGPLTVTTPDGGVRFDFAAFGSPMASRRNPDGTNSLVLAAPGLIGLEMLVTTRDGKRALVMRDGQHEYVYLEVN